MIGLARFPKQAIHTTHRPGEHEWSSEAGVSRMQMPHHSRRRISASNELRLSASPSRCIPRDCASRTASPVVFHEYVGSRERSTTRYTTKVCSVSMSSVSISLDRARALSAPRRNLDSRADCCDPKCSSQSSEERLLTAPKYTTKRRASMGSGRRSGFSKAWRTMGSTEGMCKIVATGWTFALNSSHALSLCGCGGWGESDAVCGMQLLNIKAYCKLEDSGVAGGGSSSHSDSSS